MSDLAERITTELDERTPTEAEALAALGLDAEDRDIQRGRVNELHASGELSDQFTAALADLIDAPTL